MPEHLRQPINFAQSLVVDDTRIRTELAYTDAVSPEEGIRRAIDWERANPPEKLNSKYLDFEAEDAAVAELKSHN